MKEISKKWRLDLRAFEKEYLLLGFIPYYTYSKWVHGVGEVNWWKFFRRTDWENAKY